MYSWKQFTGLPGVRDLSRDEQQRRYYRYQNLMMEAASTSPAAAASSAAAGAAGAGAGGAGNREKTYPLVFKQSHLVRWVDQATGIHKIRIYNYTDGQLASEFDTGLSGLDWYVDYSDYTVQEAGFSFVYRNNNDNKYRIFFFNAAGTHLATKSLDEYEDFQYTEGAICFLGLLLGVSTAYHFDGHNVRTHTFTEGIGFIEIDDGSEDDCTRDGSMIIDISNTKYCIMRPDGKLVDVSEHFEGVDNNYRLDYLTDFISARKSDFSLINIVGQDGVLRNSFDLSGYSIDGQIDSSLYGDNSVFWLFENLGDTLRTLVTYNGNEDRFVSMTYSTPETEIRGYHEWTWFSPESSKGKTFMFAEYTNLGSDNLGYICNDLRVTWLPNGGTEFLTQDFSAYGTVSFVDGWGWFTSDRNFSLGEEPIVMVARQDADIEVCVLGSIDAYTFSTGILSASCSNIWGNPIDYYNFAVFDVGSDRVWQIYGEGQILDQFTTGVNWSMGNGGYTANRFGTLAVVDYDEPLNNMVYTNLVGLQQGPTGSGAIYNEVDYGTRNAHTLAEQIITQYVPGEEINSYVQGFHVLYLDGLSDFVEFSAGTSSTWTLPMQSNVCVGENIIAFRLLDGVTSEVTIAVYNKSTLDLVYEQNIGLTANTTMYLDRVLIDDTTGNNTEITFVSLDVNTLSIQQTEYGYESNDCVDNDI